MCLLDANENGNFDRLLKDFIQLERSARVAQKGVRTVSKQFKIPHFMISYFVYRKLIYDNNAELRNIINEMLKFFCIDNALGMALKDIALRRTEHLEALKDYVGLKVDHIMSLCCDLFGETSSAKMIEATQDFIESLQSSSKSMFSGSRSFKIRRKSSIRDEDTSLQVGRSKETERKKQNKNAIWHSSSWASNESCLGHGNYCSNCIQHYFNNLIWILDAFLIDISHIVYEEMSHGLGAFLFAEVIIDVIFLVDILVNFRTAYF